MNKVYVIMWCNNSENWNDYKERAIEVCTTKRMAKNHIKKYQEKEYNTSYDFFRIDECTLNKYNEFF
ncbi:MAG: hypothetical protein MSS80_08195 [Mollicutes bacterium]|nr:hypothetical protein [Mollicutes bacterium]